MREIMPSIATHYLFGQDLLGRSSESLRQTIKNGEGAFRLGLQGPDIFLYDLIHTHIAKNMNFGKIMHTKRTDIFFFKYIEYLKQNDLCLNDVAVAFLYGMLCHYSLDCIAHPYIYYFTNLHDTSPDGIAKSVSNHRQFETDIDELLYHDRTGHSICNVKRTSFIKISSDEIETISPALAGAISETYKCDVSASYVKGTIKRCISLNSILNDNLGEKKKLFKNHSGQEMIFSRQLPSRKCLNENNDIWLVPVDGKVMQSSFMELYNHGLANAARLINMADDVLRGNSKISGFVTATGGKSYDTGLNWRMNEKMNYYKSDI